ncbi:hypothetical protein ASPACDRAFT_53105 [Aspergillus aculeatus ATCC 16872]|uniref:Acetate transporter n=1 Tax=Aspergillus aculeatus (strain ATCC 16872 / CBS 172.66 / WB 5094) TaxID=690307 RepID=A0A1L9WRU7_ASPA1|nr:uncharacterized protein ASPACDRAFT_53105 [Aspergillus aculeatus ATCC 16872]OJJ98933.1 hypothetical protein ASPACDRAFT_53105 [Aspergillus aculeatus ATCC 16872]
MREPQERDKEPFSPDIVADTRSSYLANPGPLGFGAFATTLMTLSFSMMGFRSVSNQTVFIANLCFLAGIGLLISAQWEMMKGNTFAYTVLGAFAFYYGGYGVLLMPPLGIVDSYGGKTSEYYNAFGLYLAVWSILNFFSSNLINITIYGALELSYIFNCTANCMMADGRSALGATFTTIAGAFGMLSALAGFYMLGHDLCQDALPFEIPLFPTSRLFLNARHGREQGRS